MYKITDPAKTLERIHVRLDEAFEMLDLYERQAADPEYAYPTVAASMVRYEKRRIAGLKSAATRVTRMI
jgi:hypothetical protein